MDKMSSRNIHTCLLVLLTVHFVNGLAENGLNVRTVIRSRQEQYHVNCGFWGWLRCSRYRTTYYKEHRCRTGYKSNGHRDCPYAICGGLINPTGACNINYDKSHIIYNGITQYSSGGTCSSPENCTGCRKGFYSNRSKCKMCSPISNCDLETCTSSSNQVCARCEGVVMDVRGQRAYAVTENKTECLEACSWRSNSTRCYPGTCRLEYASSCECIEGFSGVHCQTIDTAPNISYNMLKLLGPNLEVKEVPGDPNEGSPQETSWTNLKDIKSIKYNLTSSFIHAPLPKPRHAYVEGFAVGITDGVVTFNNFREGKKVKNQTRSCGGVSELSPNQAAFNCMDDIGAQDVLDYPIQNGDIMEFAFTVKNGGFVNITDKETNTSDTFFYFGKQETRSFRLGFDFIDPHHCSVEVTSTCSDNMMHVTKASTVSPVPTEWNGWVDNVALDYYKLSVFELINNNPTNDSSKLTQKSLVLEKNVNSTQVTTDLHFTEAGAYAIVLTAFDKAGNHKSARRISIYDGTSKVETVSDTDLLVISAAQEAEHLWQWKGESVRVDWQHRYINSLHHNNRWLKGIEGEADVEDTYDDNNFSRGISPIFNKQAIVEYRTAFLVDHNGGSTITSSPLDTDFVSQNLSEHQTVTPDLVDGDTLRFWIRAYDIRQEFLEENVTVHIDTSPPVIENLWLTRGDRLNMSVHSIEDFHTMTFEWISYDIHSGLETVSWRLFDNYTGIDIMHGTDHLSPQGETLTLDECKQKYGQYARRANCYCTPGMGCYHRHYQVKPQIIISNLTHGGVCYDMYRGVHDSDYFLEVTVMNNAKLYTKLDFQITIDASPPQSGVVYDGRIGNPELDYQDSLQLHAHWDGFFDRESGVKFYQYGFADHCLEDDEFGLDLENHNVTKTYSTYATWTSPGPGEYHITVVAYNRALEPSRLVCSDGVTVDETPPALSQIAVVNSMVKAGLVTSSSGEVWFIDNQRRRSKVVKADTACRYKGTPIDDFALDVFPLHYHYNGTLVNRQTTFCDTTSAFSTSYFNFFYISREHHLYVNWTGSDSESGIYDYKLGLMSDPSGEAAPDILPYTSTHHHPQYQGYHPGLSEGQQLYIAVKITNKAGLSNTKVIGPAIVHTSKPGFAGHVVLTLSGNQEYLLVDWSRGGFSDADSNSLIYKVAVGNSPYGTEIIPYSSIKSGGTCSLTSPPKCTVIAIRDLHWGLHQSHTYFVSVRVTNIVGLSTVGVSEPYVHDVRLPSRGVVVDMCPKKEQYLFDATDLDESDYQMSTDSLKVRWYGFDDFGLNVTYRAGIGLEPGRVDIRKFENVGYAEAHEFKQLSLQASQKYFVTILATSVGGQVMVSSDGVVVTKSNVNVENVTVYDGLGCKGNDIHKWNPGQYNTSLAENCEEDLVYQKSTSTISAHWTLADDYIRQYPDVYWRLDRKMPTSDDIWHTEMDYLHLGTSSHLLATGMSLVPGYTYRVAVKFCAVKVCSKPIYSDGVTILHRPPVAGTIRVTYSETMIESEIDVNMTRFCDPDVPVKSEAYEMIERYEWSVTDNTHDRRTLSKWLPVDSETLLTDDDQVYFKVQFPQRLEFSKCRRLAIKGYNMLGLYTIISTDIRNCEATDPVLVTPSVVIDAVGGEKSEGIGFPISLEENGAWSTADADYTPHENILSAVWPTLRYGNYTWAVVSGDKIDPTSHYKRESIMTVSDPCVIPDVIECGFTELQFININMTIPLRHGSRYYVCVHADPATMQYEKWTKNLPELNVCSDGITVDLTPPDSGRVFIGGLFGNKYQISRTEMDVYWDSFTDVEEEGLTSHPSGISHYEVALGTVPGGSDIIAERDVGLVNHVTFHGLLLQDGNIIYASVKAIDFVNKFMEVISEGVIIDSSPPSKTGTQITVLERYITKSIFEVCWEGVLVDLDSGMKRYEVSVGSRPAYDDLIPFTSLEDQCFGIDSTEFLIDGHVFYISVKGYNNAGLQTMVTSRPMVVDTSAPNIGHVYDGQKSKVKNGIKDKDYVTLMSDIGAYWEGFTDPHSSISHYLVKVGTCQGCDDILGEQNIGARTETTFSKPAFVPGIKYYVEVTACNMAGLCSKSTSDGVIVDVTPPVRGHAMDGTQDHDIQFQSTRFFLGSKWRGFYDPESELDHYEWRVGTTQGGDEILTAMSAVLEEIAFYTLPRDKQLPVGQMLYTTIRAYNKAGMCNEVSSNGFLVDDSPPEVVKVPEHLNDLGSLSTSFSRSSLKIVWEFKDDQSFIEKQYLSISSHQLGEFDSFLLKVPGFIKEYTFSRLDLHDGSSYMIKVTACNLAGLCRTSSSGEILLDSLPPNTGTFAVKTDHAARLSRHQFGWMTWTDTNLRLAWLGFSDLHSKIDQYIVTVGSEEFATDLNKENRPAVISHTSSGSSQGDEGIVQTFDVETRNMSSRRSVYVAIWAVNGVGLKSNALHSELELVPGGELELVRRCRSFNCEGQCVCAVQDGTCSSRVGCSQLFSFDLNVTDVTGQSLTMGRDADYSSFDTYMAAVWSTIPLNVKYYEISIGDGDANYPDGVFDTVNERVWFNVGQQLSAIIALPRDKSLIPGHTYSFFLRAWYNDTSYSITKSDGVMIDNNHPETTKIHSISVKELKDVFGDKDIDFQSQTDRIVVTWTNKFLQGQSGILKYRFYICTTPGGHSIYESDDLASTSYTATGLNLEPDTVYYASVLAYNKAGLVNWAYSDGVQVDAVPPDAGIVNDGQDIHDVDYQSSPTKVSASWSGFSDSDSAIIKYHWCVGTVNDTTDCSILDWQDIGLHTSASRVIAAIASGTTVWSKVYAVDAVGHRSATALSDGVVIDTSPPEQQNVAFLGENLIANPSFEVMRSLENKTVCSFPQPQDWEVVGNSCANTMMSTGGIARQGQAHIILSGSIRQKILNLRPGHKYRVSLHTGYPERIEDNDIFVEGFVSVDEEHFRFTHDPLSCKAHCTNRYQTIILWNTYSFSFTASKEAVEIKIGTTSPTMKMVVDQVSLRKIDYVHNEESETEEHLVFHTIFLSHWSSLHVSWHFSDEQSPITEYKWAVGFVKGGTQLQQFKNIGKNSHGTLSGLRLSHKSRVYVAVMATNGAGLTKLTYSMAVEVDMTPPVIEQIHDGLGQDTDFILAEEMAVNWIASDEESEIAYCDWAIGRIKGQHDIKQFERVPSGQSFAQYNMSDLVTSSTMTVFTTVRCYNKAGLASAATSDGVQLLAGSEETSISGFEILEERPSVFWERGQCHTNPTTLRLKWDDSHSGNRQLTRISLEGWNILFEDDMPTFFPYLFCKLSGFHMKNLTEYQISLRPLDYLGQYGGQSRHVFKSHGPSPTVKENMDVRIAQSTDGKITLSWNDLFTSPWTDLDYEVEVGSVLGGADIVDRYLTKVDSMELILPPVHKSINEIYISVTAIDPCGYTEHYSKKLDIF